MISLYINIFESTLYKKWTKTITVSMVLIKEWTMKTMDNMIHKILKWLVLIIVKHLLKRKILMVRIKLLRKVKIKINKTNNYSLLLMKIKIKIDMMSSNRTKYSTIDPILKELLHLS